MLARRPRRSRKVVLPGHLHCMLSWVQRQPRRNLFHGKFKTFVPHPAFARYIEEVDTWEYLEGGAYSERGIEVLPFVCVRRSRLPAPCLSLGVPSGLSTWKSGLVLRCLGYRTFPRRLHVLLLDPHADYQLGLGGLGQTSWRRLCLSRSHAAPVLRPFVHGSYY
ncbi:hypothetical protein GQ53DRAFT_524443 [Thozetella sp. PMI_491]|nr:hypothetical protein GQ53DRAFT_524443 [Thozetella sp. PMI_491]